MLFRCEVSFYVMCCQVMWCHVMWCSVMSCEVMWRDATGWDAMRLWGRAYVLGWLWGHVRWCEFGDDALWARKAHVTKKPWDMHSDVWCGPGMQTTTRLRTATVTAKPSRRNAPDHRVLRCTRKYYYVPHNITHNVLQSTSRYDTVLLRTRNYYTIQYYTALELPTQYCSVLQVLLHTRMYYSVLSFFEVLVSTAPLHRATLKPSDAQHRDPVWQHKATKRGTSTSPNTAPDTKTGTPTAQLQLHNCTYIFLWATLKGNFRGCPKKRFFEHVSNPSAIIGSQSKSNSSGRPKDCFSTHPYTLVSQSKHNF